MNYINPFERPYSFMTFLDLINICQQNFKFFFDLKFVYFNQGEVWGKKNTRIRDPLNFTKSSGNRRSSASAFQKWSQIGIKIKTE
jgi:hypothetical protein